MSGNIILGIIIIASLTAVMMLIPHLVFGLNIENGWKSLIDGKYLLFLFAHRRYSKVRSGKQTYERYCNDIRSIFNEHGFNRSKSAVENNKKIHDRAILSEMLEDQSFISQYFSNTQLDYSTFIQMNEEWDMRPIAIASEEDQPEKIATTVEIEEHKVIPASGSNTISEKDRKQEGSFKLLILDKEKEEAIISYMAAKLKTMSKGKEYAALVLALKQYDGIHYHKLNEILDCINSTFNPGIKITYTALSAQINKYESMPAFSDKEEETRLLIDTILRELTSI